MTVKVESSEFVINLYSKHRIYFLENINLTWRNTEKRFDSVRLALVIHQPDLFLHTPTAYLQEFRNTAYSNKYIHTDTFA